MASLFLGPSSLFRAGTGVGVAAGSFSSSVPVALEARNVAMRYGEVLPAASGNEELTCTAESLRCVALNEVYVKLMFVN